MHPSCWIELDFQATLHCVAVVPGGTHSRRTDTKLHATLTHFIVMILFQCNLQRIAIREQKAGATFLNRPLNQWMLQVACRMQPQTLQKPIRAEGRGLEAAAWKDDVSISITAHMTEHMLQPSFPGLALSLLKTIHIVFDLQRVCSKITTYCTTHTVRKWQAGGYTSYGEERKNIPCDEYTHDIFMDATHTHTMCIETY